MNAALIIIFATILFALALGIRARGGREMSLEQWTVGGRGFGALLVFLLMAGEIYTTFTFLGGSGFAYGRGGPAYYILGYGCLAFILSYWMLPPIWRYAKVRGLISQPDFFAAKYNSRALGVLVSLVGIVALIPYMVLQLKGLGIIVVDRILRRDLPRDRRSGSASQSSPSMSWFPVCTARPGRRRSRI